MTEPLEVTEPSTAAGPPAVGINWAGCNKPNQVCGYSNCAKEGRCLQIKHVVGLPEGQAR
jgi:hypothetical protein